MSECPSSTLRNTRKHFVKCVDCHCQTLPQNASTWTAAGALSIGGRVNDGVLCLKCANNRRETLGLPVVKSAEIPRPVCEATLKKVRINKREYSWEVSTLDSLLTKWRNECLSKTFKKRNITRFVVSINKKLISTTDFDSITISDGDEIVIMPGAVAGG